jgi:uncharacterized membrane protein YkvA (DUF1232 family)
MPESSSRRKSAPDLGNSASVVGGVVKQARLAWRLLRDSRVPGWVKLVPVAGILYLLSPIDILPEAILPVVGEVDDIVLLLMAVKLFVDLSPPGVVREHLRDILNVPKGNRSGQPPTIEVPYRVHTGEE